MTLALDHRAGRRLVLGGLVALVLLPIVVATGRAVLREWLPIGDNAIFAIRARDVLTRHHPLLGTWTSASRTIGVDVNNPGSLYFVLLAAPTRLLGDAGVAVGAAIGNALAAVGVVAVAWRRGGAPVAAAAAAMTAALLWSMGSELLFDPWQPHSLLLPFLLYLVAMWSVARGDLALLPVAAGVASLLVQTHLSYAVPVGALAVAGVAWAVPAVLRRWREGDRQPIRRVAAVTVAVAAVCWLQPVIDQVAGDGNLGELASSAGSGDETVGTRLATQIVGEVAATPPWWARPSFGQALLPDDPRAPDPRPGDLPSAAVALAALVALALVLAAAAVVARRAGRGHAAAAVGVAAIGLAVALAGTALLPMGSFGIPQHQVRYLWPLGVFTWFAVALAILPPRALAIGGAAAAAALAAAAIPTWNPRVGPSADIDAIPVLHELLPQLSALEGRGTVLFDSSTLRFAEPYSAAVLLDLRRRGVELVVDDEGWVAQLGASRRYEEGEADLRMQVRQGGAAVATDGEERIAYVAGLDRAERRELLAVREALALDLDAADLELTGIGRRAVDDGRIPPLEGEVDVEQLVRTDQLAVLLDAGYVEVTGEHVASAERFEALVRRKERATVGVFVDEVPS